MKGQKRKQKEEKEDDVWNNLRLFWEKDGPDPRLREPIFTVYSTDSYTNPAEIYAPEPEDVYAKNFSTIKGAMSCYRTRIERPKTQSCDIQLQMGFGGFYQSARAKVFCPNFHTTYIYLVRWRLDGAFVESYHVNESKFGERETDKVCDELQRTKNVPGLMSYWENKSKEN